MVPIFTIREVLWTGRLIALEKVGRILKTRSNSTTEYFLFK